MTDTTTDVDETADSVDDQGAADETAGAEQDGNPNKEAARYRRRLREAETERDALAQRAAGMQRQQVEQLAAAVLADGADVWRDGLDLAALLDEDGNIDPAKVTAAAKSVGEAHTHWSRSGPPNANRLQSGSAARQDPQPNEWQRAFTPTRRKER